nr:hypothetical protein B0A51_15882 [Rachicladosporium sp. CCFEE 5018]
MTQRFFSTESRPSSSSDNTLPPIRSVFPPHILPSSGYATLSNQALVAAHLDSGRQQRAPIGGTSQAGRGTLSIRPASFAQSSSSSAGVHYNASSSSATNSPTVSETESICFTPLSSHHSSPEFRASVPVKRGSQDSRSSRTVKKHASREDDRCDSPPCETGKMCKRHQKIVKEKRSRREQQVVHENVEDSLDSLFGHQSAKAQATGNRSSSGLDRDKQQNDNAWYTVGSRSASWIMANFGVELYEQYIQDMRRAIIEDVEQRQAGRALPLGDAMAGPHGDADVCPFADAEGNCTCADKITCRKQRTLGYICVANPASFAHPNFLSNTNDVDIGLSTEGKALVDLMIVTHS